jgi:ribonuclease E
MSRQRLRATLTSQSHSQCPHCHGSGKLKNSELVALEVLRKIQAAVVVGHVSLVKARVSPGPALFLLNNKKAELAALESKHKVKIYILADGRLRADEYEFEMDSGKGHHPEIRSTAPTAAAARTAQAARAEEELDDEDNSEDRGARTLADEEEAEAEKTARRSPNVTSNRDEQSDDSEDEDSMDEENPERVTVNAAPAGGKSSSGDE